MFRWIGAACGIAVGWYAAEAQAQTQASADLAQTLSNPVASLISVPFQFNYDEGYGPNGDGERLTINVQPVVPLPLSDNWNLISRTIVTLTVQDDVIPGTSQNGVGDVLQSVFLSPKAPTAGGLIWGAGPVFLLPTGGSNLGADQFAAGVTGVALKQSGPWTYGALANHLWDVGGGSGGTDINSTFLQPFLAYTTADAWTFTLNSESTYDWTADDAAVPINAVVSKVITIGRTPVSIGGGVRYWVDSTATGPDDWGARVLITFMYPK